MKTSFVPGPLEPPVSPPVPVMSGIVFSQLLKMLRIAKRKIIPVDSLILESIDFFIMDVLYLRYWINII
jgi:hypothetical protein